MLSAGPTTLALTVGRSAAALPQTLPPNFGLWSFILIAAGLALVVLTLRPWLLQRAARRTATPLPPAVSPTDPALELRQIVRQLAQELDRRAEHLERLIADANTAAARLEQLTAEAASAHDLAPRGSGDPLAPHARTAQPPDFAGNPADSTPDPLTRHIYHLADAGQTPVQIAQRLGQHTGQVELILALRR